MYEKYSFSYIYGNIKYMRYGNQNTKKFIALVIVVLFIGGFIKGMVDTQKTTDVQTNHLLVTIPSEFELVKYDKQQDSIVLSDNDGECTIQYDASVDQGTIDETVGDYQVSGYITEEPYTLHLNLTKEHTNVLITYQTKHHITVKNRKIQKLIQGIQIKEN